MTPHEVAETVARDTIEALEDALRLDLIEADRFVADPRPDAFMALHRGAGEALADRLFLQLDAVADGMIAGGAPEVEVADIEREACTRLVARLDWLEQRSTYIRPEWIDAASAELCQAFRRRMDLHNFTGKVGQA